MRAPDEKVSWEFSHGGAMGPHFQLKVGDRVVGHFYPEAPDDIDVEGLITEIVDIYNEETQF